MNLTPFNWWLTNQVAKVWWTITQTVATFIQDKLENAFGLARISTTTETGLKIFWAELKIQPPIDPSLRRLFLQQYNNFIETAGKADCTILVKTFFNLDYVYIKELRDHPTLSLLYPFFVVRVSIPPDVSSETEADIQEFLKIVLPARCSEHFQLVTFYAGAGFGRTPFGRRFGR